MQKTQDKLSCKKLITSIGKSEAIFNGVSTEHKMEWIFIIPKGAKISSNLSEKGGTLTFKLD